MIIDTLSHFALYENLNSGLAAALEYLQSVTAQTASGRYDIDRNNVYALVQRYATRSAETARLEAHRRYIDLQYVHSGRETMLYAPLGCVGRVLADYDSDKDATFYDVPAEVAHLRLDAGWFCILFPQDAHGPRYEWNGSTDVLKVVVKVAVD